MKRVQVQVSYYGQLHNHGQLHNRRNWEIASQIMIIIMMRKGQRMRSPPSNRKWNYGDQSLMKKSPIIPRLRNSPAKTSMRFSSSFAEGGIQSLPILFIGGIRLLINRLAPTPVKYRWHPTQHSFPNSIEKLGWRDPGVAKWTNRLFPPP